MAGQDKSVRITVVVDPASAAKAKKEIQDITREVSRLVDWTKQLGSSLGGIRVGNMAGTPGSSSATQITHAAAGGRAAQSGGIVGILTGGANNDAAVFSKAADHAKSSFKTMKDGLKDLADAGERESRRLERSFGKFAPLYAAANAQVASSRLSGLQAAGAAEVDRMRGSGPGGVKPPAPPGGMPSWLKGVIGGASAATVLWGAEKALVGGYFKNQFAETNFGLQQPLFASQAQAQAGDIFGGNAVAIRKGDAARAWAIYTLSDAKNKSKAALDYQRVISAEYKRDIQQQIKQVAPITLGENIAANAAAGGTGLGGIWSTIQDRIGAAVSHPGTVLSAAGASLAMNMGAKGPLVEAAARSKPLSAQQMNRMTEEARSVTRQAEVAQQMADQYLRAHPQFGSDINEFYGSAVGDTGLARAARISGSFYKDPRTGAHGDTVSDYIAGATAMGLSGGERAAMARRLAQSTGMRFFGHGDTLLGPEAGGLSSAAGLLGVGAQFGGGTWGGAKGFLGSIQSQIGRGGLDTIAANQLSQTIMGGMTGGNFGGGTGQGFASGMLQMAGAAVDPMRGARVANSGLGAFQQILSGGSSPLDKALNWSAALRVGGNTPWSARARLAQMDAPTLMEIMRRGDKNMDPTLRALGLNAGNIAEFMQKRGGSMFAGALNDGRFMTPQARAAFDAFQKSGGNTHYMRGMSATDRRQAEAGLAAVAMARDPRLQLEQAQGEVRALEAAYGDLDPLHGAGAGDTVSRRSPRAQALQMQAKFKREYGQRLQSGEDKAHAVTGALHAMGITADQAEAAGIDVSGAVESGGINGTIDQLDHILRKFVSQLHGEVGGAGAGPPGG